MRVIALSLTDYLGGQTISKCDSGRRDSLRGHSFETITTSKDKLKRIYSGETRLYFNSTSNGFATEDTVDLKLGNGTLNLCAKVKDLPEVRTCTRGCFTEPIARRDQQTQTELPVSARPANPLETSVAAKLGLPRPPLIETPPPALLENPRPPLLGFPQVMASSQRPAPLMTMPVLPQSNYNNGYGQHVSRTAPTPVASHRYAPPTQSWCRQQSAEYTRAASWKPKSPEQVEHFRQIKLDLYQVLLVGKGVRYRSIFSQYERIVQEDLAKNLEKAGLPNLNTLLVQLFDAIYMMKYRLDGHVYVYPNKSHEMFKLFPHIGEFVEEQRDNTQFIPHPQFERQHLVDYDIQLLLEPTPSFTPTPNYWNLMLYANTRQSMGGAPPQQYGYAGHPVANSFAPNSFTFNQRLFP